jgi:hypothetical protein
MNNSAEAARNSTYEVRNTPGTSNIQIHRQFMSDTGYFASSLLQPTYGLPVIRPELEDWDSSISPSALAERLGDYSLTYKLSSSVDIFLVCGGRA